MTTPAKPDCKSCPFGLHGQPRHTPVMGEVCGKPWRLKDPNAAPVAVMVGEGPGVDEIEQQRPFVGRTGVQLNEAMESVGLARNRYVLLNAMACRPPKGMKTNDNLRNATAACRPLLVHQLEPYAHLPTLAMGKWATAAVNKGKPITVETGRGFIRDNLLVTWHPTYAFWHNPWKAGEFTNDLFRFKRLIVGKLERPPTTIIRPSLEQLDRFEEQAWAFAELLRKLDKGHHLPDFDYAMTCDVETRAPPGEPEHWGKDPTRAALKTVAMGTPDLGVAHWWGNGSPGVEAKYIQWLKDPSVLIVFHNGWWFDDRVLRRHGVRATNIVDTKDLRRAVSATSRLSLRFLTSICTDFAPWKETEDDK